MAEPDDVWSLVVADPWRGDTPVMVRSVVLLDVSVCSVDSSVDVDSVM